MLDTEEVDADSLDSIYSITSNAPALSPTQSFPSYDDDRVNIVDEELAALAGHRTQAVFEDYPLAATRVSPLTFPITGSPDYYLVTSFTVRRISCEPDHPTPSNLHVDDDVVILGNFRPPHSTDEADIIIIE